MVEADMSEGNIVMLCHGFVMVSVSDDPMVGSYHAGGSPNNTVSINSSYQVFYLIIHFLICLMYRVNGLFCAIPPY
eukprot:scaffold354304_cov21-Prasinocladus_malaysianus.AAC.1